MDKSSKRYDLADLLKGLAVLFMIQVHLMEVFALPDVYRSVIGKISLFLGGPPAAPIFMAVMGFFLAKSSKSTIQLLLRGIKIFLGGLALNIFLNLNLLIRIFNGHYPLNPLKYIFGVDILFLAGLSIILIALLKPLLNKSYLVPFVLALLVTGLSEILKPFGENDSFLAYINAFLYGDFSWSYFPLFPWFAYPLLGYAFFWFLRLYSHKLWFNLHKTLLILIVWCLGLWITRNIFFDVSTNLFEYYHHGSVFFILCVLFLAGYLVLTQLLIKYLADNKIIIYIIWLGKNVTTAYVLQWIIIGNIATEIYQTQSVQSLVIWFVLITGTVSAGIYFWEKYRKQLKEFIFSN